MKSCQQCKRLCIRERNGVRISKLCLLCRKMKETQKKEKHKLTKTFQESEWKRLHKKAWKLMSEWIRRKDANLDGYVDCYTCSAVKPWKKMHAGHFKHGRLDFDERNLKVQCPQCNKDYHGRLDVYGIRLMNEYSQEWLNALELSANTHPGYTLTDLDEIIKELTNKLLTLS